MPLINGVLSNPSGIQNENAFSRIQRKPFTPMSKKPFVDRAVNVTATKKLFGGVVKPTASEKSECIPVPAPPKNEPVPMEDLTNYELYVEPPEFPAAKPDARMILQILRSFMDYQEEHLSPPESQEEYPILDMQNTIEFEADSESFDSSFEDISFDDIVID